MKTLHITSQKVNSLLKNHLETPLSEITQFAYDFPYEKISLMGHAKLYLEKGQEILLSSGARLCYEPSIIGQFNNLTKDNFISTLVKHPVDKTGWFIAGYSADGSDISCYYDKKVYAQKTKYGQILKRRQSP